MSLGIFFSEDIRNALLAANEASAATAAVVAESCPVHLPRTASITCSVCGKQELYADVATLRRAYREGYKAALTTVALAFGIAPTSIDGKQ